MKAINYKNKEMMVDAAQMLKSIFVGFYESQGYDEEELGKAWHEFRRMPECQKLVGRVMRYQAPVEKDGHRPEDLDLNEKKEKVEELPDPFVDQDLEAKKASPQKTEAISSSNDKLVLVKELMEKGITKNKDIAQHLGISTTYAYKLIKQLK